MNTLGKIIDRVTQNVDRLIGCSCTYVSRSLKPSTGPLGKVEFEESKCAVLVQEMPITTRDLTEFTRAGLPLAERKWSIRRAYVEAPQPLDELHVGDDIWQVMEQPSSVLHEFGVDAIFFTRKVR